MNEENQEFYHEYGADDLARGGGRKLKRSMYESKRVATDNIENTVEEGMAGGDSSQNLPASGDR